MEGVPIFVHPFDNYVIRPGSLAFINRRSMTLRHLQIIAKLPRQKILMTYCRKDVSIMLYCVLYTFIDVPI